jgi:O-antigen/teichoic acid export membrane protein
MGTSTGAPHCARRLFWRHEVAMVTAAPAEVAAPAAAAITEVKDTGLFTGVARHSMVYGLGMIIGRAVSFIMLPIYTRYLTPADYGVMALVEMTLDFVTILAGARLVVGFFHFYHGAETEQQRNEASSTSFLLIAGLYAVVGVTIMAAAEPLSRLIFQSDAQTLVIRLAAANVACQSLLIVPLSLARVEDRSIMYVMANLAKLFLALALNVTFLVVLGLGVKGVFMASLTANALVGGALAAWLLRRTGWSFSPVMTRKILRFGVPLIATQMAAFVVTFGDRYFLQAVADEAAVGLYNLAYTFGFLLVMVGFTPMDQAWGPKRFEVARRPNAGPILARGFILLNVLLLTVATGIGLLAHDVIRIMAAPAFHPAAAVIPVILVAYVLECWSGVQDIGILIKERTEYITLANMLSAAAALVGYTILIPLYLTWGAAAATVLAFAVRHFFTYRYSQMLFPVEYRWRPVVILCTWSVSIVSTGLLLPELPVLTSLLTRVLLVGLYFAGLWLLPILEPADRHAILRHGRSALMRLTHRRAALSRDPP